MFNRNFRLKDWLKEFDDIYESLSKSAWEIKNEMGLEEKTESGENENGKWKITTYTTPGKSGITYKVTTYHAGSDKSETTEKETEISMLKKELAQVVEKQDFEKAVELRDKIKKLETSNKEITKLESDLKSAIDKEDFETAIKLRDKIKKMKS